MADFLFELGVEEVPVADINNLLEQLKSGMATKLTEEGVDFKNIEVSATNKKFMLYITDISKKMADKEESILGPSKQVAYQPDGSPSIALEKFLENNNSSIEDILEIQTKRGTYVGINKKVEGKDTIELLKKLLPELLGSLSFSKTMVWNRSRIPFIRPITNILALLDGQLVPINFAGIPSTKQIKGHSLLSDGFIEVNSFKEYIELLNKNFVIIDVEERREKIVTEIKEIEEDINGTAGISEEMIEFYIYSNDYPVVFQGEFNKKYLTLPNEIISTFMTTEKKLLPVYDNRGRLKNLFIGVSNIPDENKNVVRGNEKVIQAAFEDANFFWEKDKQEDFFSRRENLKDIIFQKNLGSFYDKTERLRDICDFLIKATDSSELTENLKLAACHCKNDLVTRMVREFPSLQGIMGGLYLQETGQEKDLWETVYWHYEPKGYTDIVLKHKGGALLSIADKIDNITAFLSRGVKISSSKDPFGMRRDANGLIKCMIDFKLNFDLLDLIGIAAKHFCPDEKECTALIEKTAEFFKSRLESIFKDSHGIRYDVVNSVLNQEFLMVYKIYLRTIDVSKMAETETVKYLSTLHKRLKNIIKDNAPMSISEELLVEESEKLLFEVFLESKTQVEKLIASNDYLNACTQILEMKPIIDTFFEKVLVMVEDKKLRENRIALLQGVDELLGKIADFSVLV